MKAIILAITLLISTNLYAYKQFDQVTMGDPQKTNAAALLEMVSTTQGFLLPRMTTAQRDAIPAPLPISLQLFNTDTQLINYWDGLTWDELGVSDLQEAYDASTAGDIELDNTKTGFSILDDTVTPLGSNLLEVKDTVGAEVIGVTATAINAIQLNIDSNLRLDGSVLSSQVTNGNISLSPNGTGSLLVSTGAVVTGNVDATSITVDNLRLDGNTLDATTGNLVLDSIGTYVETLKKARISSETASTVPYLDANKELTSSAVTPTELGYVGGVTSAIQTQIEAVHNISQGGTNSGTALANDLVMTSTAGAITESTTTATELSYLNTTTSDVQVQIDSKEPTITNLPISKGGTNSTTALANDLVITSTAGALTESTTTATELSYLNTTTSDVQVQLDSKVSLTATQSISGTKTFTGRLATSSTTNSSTPFPVMTNAQRDVISGPTKGDTVYSSDDNTPYQYDGTAWVEMGAGGGGGLDVFHTEDYEKTLTTAWSTGNNATILGGGTLVGTLNTTQDIIKETSFTYTHHATTATVNDYFCSEAITLSEKEKSNDDGYTFHYSYDGDDDDIQVIVWDVTNSANIAAAKGLELIKARGDPTRYPTSFYPPSTATDIRYCFQVLVTNANKILTWDDTFLSTDPFVDTVLYSENSFSGVINPATGGSWTSKLDGVVTAVSRSTDTITITLATDKFTVAPIVQLTLKDSGALIQPHTMTTSATTITFRQQNYAFANDAADREWNITITNDGADYISPTKNIVTPASAGSQTSWFIDITGYASTNTKIPYFTTLVGGVGDGVEGALYKVTNNSTDGFAIEALEDIIVTASYAMSGVGLYSGWSKNSTQLTTDVQSITGTHVVGSWMYSDGGNDSVMMSEQVELSKGDILRPHTNSASFSATTGSGLTISARPTEVKMLAATPITKVAYLKDIKSSGTAGGSTTADTTHTRTLNAVEGDSEIVSLSANQFTLSAGKYIIEAYAPVYQSDSSKVFIYNTSDSTYDIEGQSSEAGSTIDVQGEAKAIGTITITVSKTYELRHWVRTAQATNGFGVQSNFGTNPDSSEVYSIVKITKIFTGN